MGTDVMIYLGPTIVVPTKTVKTTVDLYCCSSTSCKKHTKAASEADKFCSSCGSANQNRQVASSSSLEPYEEDADNDYDHWYELFENHNVDDRTIYTPNFDLDEKDIFSVYDSEKYSEFDFDLSNVDLKSNLDKFKQLPETKEVLELLQRFYNDDEIIISYRLFKYCC
jgi:hypothetical protein